MSTAQRIPGDHLLFFLTAILGTVAELLSKHLVFRFYHDGAYHDVVPLFLQIYCCNNYGALFSIGQGWGPLFVVLSIAAVVFIPVMHVRLAPTAGQWQAFGLGAIEAGALGNLCDRLFFGSVRDFVVLHWGEHRWPTFNIADALICAGLAALFVSTLRKPHRDEPSTVA